MSKDTLKDLVEIYMTNPAEARRRIETLAPEPPNVVVVRPTDSRSVARTHIGEERIRYQSFDAPPEWEMPYAIEQVSFGQCEQPADYMHHAGEELLVAIEGAIDYVFVSQPGGVEQLQSPLHPGDLIRVNCSIPHNTFPVGGDAKAWMTFLDIRQTASAIATAAEPSQTVRVPRLKTNEELQSPANWALTAWGIADRIRMQRERNGLSLKQVAGGCGIDPSYLSRIEAADANVTLETLVGVARFLGIRAAELVPREHWIYQISANKHRSPKRTITERSLAPSPVSHSLHARRYYIPAGTVWPLPYSPGYDFESWILLSGLALFEGPDAPSAAIVAGSVLHSRSETRSKLRVIEDATLFNVRFSAHLCECSWEKP